MYFFVNGYSPFCLTRVSLRTSRDLKSFKMQKSINTYNYETHYHLTIPYNLFILVEEKVWITSSYPGLAIGDSLHRFLFFIPIFTLLRSLSFFFPFYFRPWLYSFLYGVIWKSQWGHFLHLLIVILLMIINIE